MANTIPPGAVLIADSLAPTRDRLSAALRAKGWKVSAAVSEEDLLRCIKRDAPDLMIVSSDLNNGKGIRTLRSLSADLGAAQVPTVLLLETDALPQELRSKPFPESIQPLSREPSFDSFLESVLRTAEVVMSSAPPAATRVDLSSRSSELADALGELDRAYLAFESVVGLVKKNQLPGPLAPGVLGEMLMLLADPDVSFKAIATCLKKHQTLSARLLEVANSARYSRGARVTSVDSALSNLGLRVVSTQLQAFAAQQYVVGKNPKLRAMISQSLATAYAVSLVTDDLARLTKATRAPGAQLVGLFHNIGQTFFLYALALLEEQGQASGLSYDALGTMISNRMGAMNDLLCESLKLPADVGAVFGGTGQPRSQTVELVHKAVWVVRSALGPDAPATLRLDLAGEQLGMNSELLTALNASVPVIRSLVANYR